MRKQHRHPFASFPLNPFFPSWSLALPEAREAIPFTASSAVLEVIETHIGQHRAERGAMLGGNRARGEVTAVHIDLSARTAGAEYSPDVDTLNCVLKQWEGEGIEFLGFVHSHPSGIRRPSTADQEYAGRILSAMPGLDAMLMPIVMTVPDTGRYELLAYAAVRAEGTHAEVVPACITVNSALDSVAKISVGEEQAAKKPDAGAAASAAPAVALDELRARVVAAYDGPRLARTRVVVIGVGGARGVIEGLARAFVGEFVLIDHDQSSASNVATQAAYVSEIGTPKVAALAARVLEINPYARIRLLPRRAESISEQNWARLLTPEGDIEHVTLLAMADDFYAQALGHRLALNYGVPSVAAGMFKQGDGFNVTFTHPEVTPACHRCALSSQYAAYLDRDFVNDTTSHGTPYCAIEQFNGVIEYVTLAVMHHGSAHPRWGGLLKSIGNRNLVLGRLWPDFTLPSIDGALANADRERLIGPCTVWCPQPGDHPKNNPAWAQCPDCGGLGDLYRAKGTFDGALQQVRREVPDALRGDPTPGDRVA
ncbi:MAG: ThiF family adenylyltransferase [Burkholderiales bacterium]|nr:ThiF family adenylyltransferase [Burkholderiales bacterium]